MSITVINACDLPVEELARLLGARLYAVPIVVSKASKWLALAKQVFGPDEKKTEDKSDPTQG